MIVSSLADQQIFIDKAGEEVLNQMYTFKDKKGRPLCLIPEVTAVVQEWYKNNKQSLKQPTKVFYVNRCYRYEKPQAGRYREFTQFGVEILGNKTNSQKEELLDVLKQCLDLFSISYTLNYSVKRGLSYYTEDGFEAECSSLGAQKQVAGGGRYSEGIGFGIGVERLMLAQNKEN